MIWFLEILIAKRSRTAKVRNRRDTVTGFIFVRKGGDGFINRKITVYTSP
jgi:hypothetical protein